MSRRYTEASKQHHQGFTLIELMIVIFIVAVLAAVAIPMYRNHIIKTNRTAAESFMSQIANKEEQVMLDLRNYVAVANNAAFPNAPTTGLSMTVPADVNTNYSLQVTTTSGVGAAPTYKITATPNNPPQNDPLCQSLTLDSTGNKGVANTGSTAPIGSTQVCWQ